MKPDKATKQTSANRAFTLIEILVVVAIIGILAAILFPVFARVRENARRSSCASNMKQIGLGLIQYSQDYNERLPVTPKGNTTTLAEYIGGWAGPIYPYVKSRKIYACPSDPTRRISAFAVMSYAYNSNIGLDEPDTTKTRQGIGGRIAAMTAPAKTVLAVELIPDQTSAERGYVDVEGADKTSGGVGISGVINGTRFSSLCTQGLIINSIATGAAGSGGRYFEHGTGYMGNRNSNINSQFPDAEGRHLDGSNFLFADGHMKWLKGSAVSSGNWIGTRASTAAQTGAASGLAAGTGVSTFAGTFSPT